MRVGSGSQYEQEAEFALENIPGGGEGGGGGGTHAEDDPSNITPTSTQVYMCVCVCFCQLLLCTDRKSLNLLTSDHSVGSCSMLKQPKGAFGLQGWFALRQTKLLYKVRAF